jgi:hypothetical protein
MTYEMEPVVSSRITEYAYDAPTATIYVTFHDGTRWQYRQVPEYVWAEFKAAPSKGTYIHDVLNYYDNGPV